MGTQTPLVMSNDLDMDEEVYDADVDTGVEEGDDDNKWVTKTLMIAHEQSAHKASAPAAQFAGAAAAVLQGIFCTPPGVASECLLQY